MTTFSGSLTGLNAGQPLNTSNDASFGSDGQAAVLTEVNFT